MTNKFDHTIKYRAWDYKREEMRQVQLMDWSDWWVSTAHTWQRGDALTFGERNSFKNERTDRHFLMQYTGLHDRNNTEIYEGDIVALPVGKDKYMEAIIVRRYGGFYFSWMDERVSKIRGKVEEPIFHNMHLWEVIGNIYKGWGDIKFS